MRTRTPSSGCRLPAQGRRAGHARRGQAALGVVGLDKARVELDATEPPEEIGRYMVAPARKTRELPGVELGELARIIHLASAARANARLSGRDVVTVEDVQEIAPYVLRHRLIVDEALSPDERAADGARSRPRAGTGCQAGRDLHVRLAGQARGRTLHLETTPAARATPGRRRSGGSSAR